jgi:hypothetical protein
MKTITFGYKTKLARLYMSRLGRTIIDFFDILIDQQLACNRHFTCYFDKSDTLVH